MKRIIMVLLTNALLTIPSLSYAVIVKVNFQGTVIDPTFSMPSDSAVFNGDTISGYLTYDTNATPDRIGDLVQGGSIVGERASYPGFESVFIEGNGTVLASWLNNPLTNEPNDSRYNNSRMYINNVVGSFNNTQEEVGFESFYENRILNQIVFLSKPGDNSIIDSITPPNLFPTNWLFDRATGSVINVRNGSTDPNGPIQAIARINVVSVTTIPVPAAVWLFGSGIIGLISIARRTSV